MKTYKIILTEYVLRFLFALAAKVITIAQATVNHPIFIAVQ